ncbi:MAG: hypothetical protein QOF00_4078 [Pseudonocardiales bacterium]|nr:hypothetical protein [Pseudonocardiales bacterium]
MNHQVELLGPPVLRVAAWPLDTLDGFRAADLAGDADRILVRRHVILDRRHELSSALFRVVPELAPIERRHVLALRRALYAGAEPVEPGTAIAALSGRDGLISSLLRDAADRDHVAGMTARFRLSWAAEERRQRELLRATTASPAFRRALAVGHPQVYDEVERIGTGSTEPTDSKQRRRLDDTLWRLLARACTRPTPQGLWAGVAPLGPPRSGAGPAEYGIGVRLAPFRAVVEALAARQPLRGPLRRDPSVHRDEGGWWWLGVGPAGPVWSWLTTNPLLDVILTAFDGGLEPHPGRLISEVAGGSPSVRDRLPDVLRSLIARGVLRPAVGLPGAASDVWVALDAVTGLLPADDGAEWTRCIALLKVACAGLATGLTAGWPPERVRAQVRACDDVAVRLCAHAGVDAPATGIVTVDLRLGAELGLDWTGAHDARAVAAVSAGLSVHGADGGAERYRRESVAELSAALAGHPPLSPGEAMRRWDALRASRRYPGRRPITPDSSDTRPGILDHRFGSRPFAALGTQADCDTWEDRLAAHWREPVFTADLPGGVPPTCGRGAVLLAPDGRGGLAFLWGRPQPGLFQTRHRGLSPVGDGLRAALGEAVELVGRDCDEPAVAVRPELTRHRLDLGSAAAGRWRFTAAPDGRIWLSDSDEPENRRLPIYSSAAAMGAHDPLGELLWTAAMSHGWEWLSFGLPALPAERAAWGHHPEVRSPDGITVAARRWTLSAATVSSITAAAGPDRYLAWRDAVRNLAVPELVQLRTEDPQATPSAVPTSSPLAVDAFFGRLRSTPVLVVTPVPRCDDADGSVVDSAGRAHVHEIGVSWRLVDAPSWQPDPMADARRGTRPPIDPDLATQRLAARDALGHRWVQMDLELPDRRGWAELAAGPVQWSEGGLVTRWWLLHKPPGIRLRFESSRPDELTSALSGWRTRPQGLAVAPVAVGGYEPEVDRFGGPLGLELAHTHFAADSRLLLAWRTGELDDGPGAAVAVGLVTAQALFAAVAEDVAELRDIWLRLEHAVGPIPPNPAAPPEAAVVRAVLAGRLPETADSSAAALYARAARWATRTGDAAAELRRSEGFRVRSWVSAVAIFHWNRWALTTAELGPLVAAVLAELGRD